MTCFCPITCWQKTCFTFPKNRYFRTSYWKYIEIEKSEPKPLFTQKQKEFGRKRGINENILNTYYQESRYTKKPVFIPGPIKNNIESNLIAIGTEAKTYKKLLFKKPKNTKNYRELKVPCGRCIGCLLDRSNSWATRCWCECQNWVNNCFITLTYNEQNLPKNRQLLKKDLQDFWKRLRYYEQGYEYWDNPRTGKHERPIRYYSCGEYGTKNKRPHYHACVFNWKPKDLRFYKYNHQNDPLYTSKQLNKIWGKGYVIIGNLNYQSACYVARYVTKKMFGKTAKTYYINKVPEFTESSRNGGIGIKYWNENKQKIIDAQGIYIKIKDKVKLKQIPKYFIKKWSSSKDWENCERYKYKKQCQGKEINKIQMKQTSLNESEYLKLRMRNLLDKVKILRRDNDYDKTLDNDT